MGLAKGLWILINPAGEEQAFGTYDELKDAVASGRANKLTHSASSEPLLKLSLAEFAADIRTPPPPSVRPPPLGADVTQVPATVHEAPTLPSLPSDPAPSEPAIDYAKSVPPPAPSAEEVDPEPLSDAPNSDDGPISLSDKTLRVEEVRMPAMPPEARSAHSRPPPRNSVPPPLPRPPKAPVPSRPPPKSTATSAPPPAGDVPMMSSVAPPSLEGRPTRPTPEGSGPWLIVGGIAVASVIGYLAFGRGHAADAPAEVTVAPSATASALVVEAPDSAATAVSEPEEAGMIELADVDGGAPGVATPETVTSAASPVSAPASSAPLASMSPAAPAVAVAAASAAPAAPPVDLATLLARAKAAEKAGDLAAARGHYEAALARGAAGLDVLLALGNITKTLGDRGAATSYFQRAVSASPASLPALLGQADVEWESGERSKAKAHYQNIIDKFPVNAYPPRVRDRLTN